MDKIKEKYKTTCWLMEWVLILQSVLLILVAVWMAFNKGKYYVILCGNETMMLYLFLVTLSAIGIILATTYALIEEKNEIMRADLTAIKLFSYFLIILFVIFLVGFLTCIVRY